MIVDADSVRADLVADVVDCFQCGSPLVRPYVFWAGQTASIGMHPNCALDHVLRLSRDLWQLQRDEFALPIFRGDRKP